jgi:hypothetical protein
VAVAGLKTGYVDHTGHFPDAVAKPSVEHFQPDVLFKKGFDLMIRYSYCRGTNYRTNLSAPTQLLSSLEKEYRELQDLRERIREAEAAAAKRLRPRGKLKTCARPVSDGSVAEARHAESQAIHQAPALRHASWSGRNTG